MRWFTSDTHFGHQGILRHEPEHRPFSSTEEMDEVMIERWNAVVRPRDIVYHLGDVAMGTIADSLPKIGRLNGQKILIPGNHDRIFSGLKKGQERFLPEYKKVFQIVQSEQHFTNLGHDKNLRVLMCHFPYEGDSHGEDRYADKRPVNRGLPLIHGHIHGSSRLSFTENGTAQIHVGMDAWGLAPVHEDEVISMLENLP